MRTNLHYFAWRFERDGLLERIDAVLGMAARQGMGVMLCLFDDCEFSGEAPFRGAQPAPKPGVHNSRALGSPGRALVGDRAEWPRFGAYVRDVVDDFARDPRVTVWDLYNEPGNRMIFEFGTQPEHDPALEPDSAALMRASFDWARAVDPDQPLTVAQWRLNPLSGEGRPSYRHPIDRNALALSDVVSFHANCTLVDRAPGDGSPRGVLSSTAGPGDLLRSVGGSTGRAWPRSPEAAPEATDARPSALSMLGGGGWSTGWAGGASTGAEPGMGGSDTGEGSGGDPGQPGAGAGGSGTVGGTGGGASAGTGPTSSSGT